jgi:hypothetical protein
MLMKEITIWYELKKDGSTALNHIADGWVFSEHPLPVKPEFTNQTAWVNMKWKPVFGYLTNDQRVIRLDGEQ